MANAPPPEAFQLTLMYLCAGPVQVSSGRSLRGSWADWDTHSGGSDEVCVPCAIGDLDILVAVLFLARLSEDVTARRGWMSTWMMWATNASIALTDISMLAQIET